MSPYEYADPPRAPRSGARRFKEKKWGSKWVERSRGVANPPRSMPAPRDQCQPPEINANPPRSMRHFDSRGSPLIYVCMYWRK